MFAVPKDSVPTYIESLFNNQMIDDHLPKKMHLNGETCLHML